MKKYFICVALMLALGAGSAKAFWVDFNGFTQNSIEHFFGFWVANSGQVTAHGWDIGIGSGYTQSFGPFWNASVEFHGDAYNLADIVAVGLPASEARALYTYEFDRLIELRVDAFNMPPFTTFYDVHVYEWNDWHWNLTLDTVGPDDASGLAEAWFISRNFDSSTDFDQRQITAFAAGAIVNDNGWALHGMHHYIHPTVTLPAGHVFGVDLDAHMRLGVRSSIEETSPQGSADSYYAESYTYVVSSITIEIFEF